jgi:sugar O-acyltransferase (sialic acid O-acetyltransferase NeuD family)
MKDSKGGNGRSDHANAPLYLAGSGSFAVEVAEWARDAGRSVVGLIELRDPARVGMTIASVPVLATTPVPAGGRVAVAMGGSRRDTWSSLEHHGWQPATIVHPAAHVSPTARLGAGCVIGPGAVVGAETEIGAHTLVSRGTLIGHHCQIGAFVSLMPGANVGGHTKIGEHTTVGMGAVVVNTTEIGAGATVAAGALVLRDVRGAVRVQGLPAREYAL